MQIGAFLTEVAERAVELDGRVMMAMVVDEKVVETLERWWSGGRGGGEVEEVVELCEGKKRYLSAGFLHLSTPTWSIKSTSASQK